MVFQFVQIGDDEEAEKSLRKLGNESEVAKYVHVIPGTTVTDILSKFRTES